MSYAPANAFYLLNQLNTGLANGLLLENMLNGFDPYISPNLLSHLIVTSPTTITLQASANAPVTVGTTVGSPPSAVGTLYAITSSSTSTIPAGGGPGTYYIIVDTSTLQLIPTMPASSSTTTTQVLLGSVYYDPTVSAGGEIGLQPQTLDFGPSFVLPSSQIALNLVRYDGGGTSQAEYSNALASCTPVPATPFYVPTQMLAIVISRIAGTFVAGGAVQTYTVIDSSQYAESKFVGSSDFRTLGFDVTLINPGHHTLNQWFATSGGATVQWSDNHAYLLLFRLGEVI